MREQIHEYATERTRKRNGRIDRLSARKQQLEQTLIEVWRWTTFDGVDVESLRAILLKADPDAAVHATLDEILGDRRGA